MCALVYSSQLSDTAQQMYNWAELQVPMSVSQFKPRGALYNMCVEARWPSQRGHVLLPGKQKKKLTEAHRGYVSWPEWLSPRGCVLLAVEIDRSPQGLRVLASVAEPEGLCVKASAAKPMGAMCHGQSGRAHRGHVSSPCEGLCLSWPMWPSPWGLYQMAGLPEPWGSGLCRSVEETGFTQCIIELPKKKKEQEFDCYLEQLFILIPYRCVGQRNMEHLREVPETRIKSSSRSTEIHNSVQQSSLNNQ